MSSIFDNSVQNRLVLPQAAKLTICFKKTIKEGEPRQRTRLLTLGWEVHFVDMVLFQVKRTFVRRSIPTSFKIR